MRAPPPVPDTMPIPVSTPIISPEPIVHDISKSESFHSQQEEELSIDDIDDFEDEEEVDNIRVLRRQSHDTSDLSLGLPLFETGKCNHHT